MICLAGSIVNSSKDENTRAVKNSVSNLVFAELLAIINVALTTLTRFMQLSMLSIYLPLICGC